MFERLAGAAALTLASGLGLAVLVQRILAAGSAGVHHLDDVVALAVLMIGALLLAWYLLTAGLALICLLARAAGHAWLAGESRIRARGAPVARRLLLSGGSAAVAAAAALSPAMATPPLDLGPVATAVDDLGWGAGDAETDAADDADATDEPSETDETDETDDAPVVVPASAATEIATYTVVSGDSLWSIAADHLPEGSSDSAIAAAWPAWYAQNSDVIGADPDLIHPGLVLSTPGPDLEEEA